jgi:hypothetical protein
VISDQVPSDQVPSDQVPSDQVPSDGVPSDRVPICHPVPSNPKLTSGLVWLYGLTPVIWNFK